MSTYKSPGKTTRSPGRTKSSGTLASLTGGAPGGAARGTAGKLAACLAYGAVSVSITMFNKAVFSVYHFQYPAFVTTLQVWRGGADFVAVGTRCVFLGGARCSCAPSLPSSRNPARAHRPSAQLPALG